MTHGVPEPSLLLLSRAVVSAPQIHAVLPVHGLVNLVPAMLMPAKLPPTLKGVGIRVPIGPVVVMMNPGTYVRAGMILLLPDEMYLVHGDSLTVAMALPQTVGDMATHQTVTVLSRSVTLPAVPVMVAPVEFRTVVMLMDLGSVPIRFLAVHLYQTMAVGIRYHVPEALIPPFHTAVRLRGHPV